MTPVSGIQTRNSKVVPKRPTLVESKEGDGVSEERGEGREDGGGEELGNDRGEGEGLRVTGGC